MASSGLTSQAPNANLVDLTLEVFERLQWRGAALTQDMLVSARRSFNLVFSRWSNLGVNLWRVSDTPIRLPLVQGQTSYDVDASVISILPEAYIRQYTMMAAVDVNPSVFATTISTSVLTINQTAHGMGAGNFTQIVVPVSIGGLSVSGFFVVATVVNPNTFTVDVGTAATSTVSGGTVPSFTTVNGSSTVTVTQADHGQIAGDTYYIGVSTTAGGLTLTGNYTVASVPTANTFTFDAGSDATSSAVVSENSGNTQIAAQDPSVNPTDRVPFPLSRADYSAIPNKSQQGMPTSFWFNRQINPLLLIWPLPDQNGPYELQYYALKQIEDANNQGAETPNVPYRALETLASAVAAHVAMKWRPEVAPTLQAWADQMWLEFSDADREKVPFYVTPDFSGY